MRIKRADLQGYFIDLGYILSGTVILAFGSAVFLIPFDLVSGGVSGISIALSKLLSVDTEILIALISWGCFILGAITLGADFFFKTFLSSLTYPSFVSLFLELSRLDVLRGYFALGASEHRDLALLIAALLGGILVGLGCALSFKGGGSTGGIDIIALTISKLFPKLKCSRVILFFDAAIVLLGAFAVKSFILTSLGVISAFMCSFTIDRVLFVKK